MYNKLHREVIRDPRILGCAIISLFMGAHSMDTLFLLTESVYKK